MRIPRGIAKWTRDRRVSGLLIQLRRARQNSRHLQVHFYFLFSPFRTRLAILSVRKLAWAKMVLSGRILGFRRDRSAPKTLAFGKFGELILQGGGRRLQNLLKAHAIAPRVVQMRKQCKRKIFFLLPLFVYKLKGDERYKTYSYHLFVIFLQTSGSARQASVPMKFARGRARVALCRSQCTHRSTRFLFFLSDLSPDVASSLSTLSVGENGEKIAVCASRARKREKKSIYSRGGSVWAGN